MMISIRSLALLVPHTHHHYGIGWYSKGAEQQRIEPDSDSIDLPANFSMAFEPSSELPNFYYLTRSEGSYPSNLHIGWL